MGLVLLAIVIKFGRGGALLLWLCKVSDLAPLLKLTNLRLN